MERYKIIYTWKCVNGIVPNLGFKWGDSSDLRNGKSLIYPKLVGSSKKLKTVQRRSITYEGVRLFNCLPVEVRLFSGKQSMFKSLLDKFLTEIPDCPETDNLVPAAKDCRGRSSNSIPDWLTLRPDLKKFPQDDGKD